MWIISERSYSQVIASLRWRRARDTAGRASCGYRCDSCRILNRLLVLSGANIPKHCRSRAKKYGEVRSIQVATKFIQFPVPLAFFSLTKGMPFFFFFFEQQIEFVSRLGRIFHLPPSSRSPFSSRNRCFAKSFNEADRE